MAYGFQGLKSLGLEGEQTQEAPMSLPVKQPEYDPSGYASFAKPSVSDTKGEIKQSPRDIVTAKYGYTPGQMPGINKDVAGVQGTAFNNWDDTTKQSIRKSIAETPVVKKPSVKEAVRKAGYNPDQSLADLSATLIANGGDITPEDLQMKFPEFAGKEQAVSDFIATMAATPNITPEEVKMKFPEFYDQQAIGMDGGLRATAARGNEERSIYSKIGDALNPAGLLTEFIDNVAQKIPVFDPEAYVDRKTGERVGELTPEKVAEYYKKYESSPNAKKLFGSFDEYIKAKHMTLLEGLIDSPTITMYANMPGSFAKNYSGIARGIENPVDTAIGLYKLAATPEGHAMLMQRYGTQKGREDAIKYDPVGVASDLLTIVEGGANLTRLSAKGTSLVAKAAGAEKLAANATKVATQAGEVAITAGGASNLGADIAINKGFNVLGSMAEGNKIAEKTVKMVKFAQAPVSETFKAAKKGKVGEFVTRTLPVSRIEKALGLTPTERGNVESTGVSAGEYMLQKNLGGLEKEEQISRLANIADESYNGVTKELKKIPLNVRTASEPAKKMLQVMVDEMESSKIVADAYPDYISKLKEMIAQKDYHPEELNAIKRDFDKIVGSKMYNSKGRVTNFEDGIIDGYRKELYSQLETVANEHGLDIRGMNTDMRNAMTIRNGLIRRASQVNKNNTFGLQDIGIGAILAAGDPVTATAVVLAKKGIEQAVPGISQKLYNLNPKKTGSNPNLKRGVPVSPRDKSNGMSITNTAADRRILAGKIEADYKTKNPALPEKSQGYTLGTKKNPIVAGLPEGYVAKPVKDLSNMEKIAATPQDAPKKGYETKIGKVTDITNNGGAYPTYRVKVEGSDKRHNIDEIGGVYKPKIEVKMPRQEKTDAPKQEPEGLKVAPGGRKEYYLKLIKEEYGIDINKIDVQDIPKLKEAINSRTPAKAEEILKGLQEKYKGKKYKRQDLYHGTTQEFDKFEKNKFGKGEGSMMYGEGVDLTDNKDIAKIYADMVAMNQNGINRRYGENPQKSGRIQASLKDKRVLINTTLKDMKIYDIQDNIQDLYDNVPYIQNYHDEAGYLKPRDISEVISSNVEMSTAVANYVKKKGYDGLSYPAGNTQVGWGKDGKNYKIFDPDKIGITSAIRFKRDGAKGTLTVDEAKTYVQKYFKEGEVSAKFVEGMTTPEGRTALGAYADGLIEFTKNPTKELLDHEALHAYIDKFTDTTRRDAVYKAAQEKHALEIGGIQKKYGISKLEATEEWIADGFAEYAAGKRTFTGKVASYFKTLWNDIKTVFGKGDAVKSLYKDLETGKRTTGLIDKSGKPMKVFRRDDAVLYRAGGLEDKNKTGIFLSNDKSVADNYKDTGLGGKTTLAYKIDENANLYKGENRRQLIQELDPMYAKGRDEREYKWAKQYKGEGPTAQQKSQRETEKRIKMILQKKGYDGVEYNGKGNDQAGEYQIFDKKTLQPEGLKPKMYKRGDVKPFEARVYRGMVDGEGDKSLGGYYSTDKESAETYKMFKEQKTKKEGKVASMNIRLDNPLRVADNHIDAFEELKGKIPGLKKILNSMYDEDITDIKMDDAIVLGEQEMQKYAKKQGYDGIVFGDGGIIIDMRQDKGLKKKNTMGLKPKMYKRGDVQSPQEYIKSKVTAYDDGIGRFEKKFGTRPKNIDELVATVMKDKEKLKYYTGYEDATKMKDELEHVFDKPAKTNYFENKPLYHGTDAKSAESIVKGGFDTSKASKVAEEPYAVFASLHKDEGPGYSAGTYGDTILRVVPNGKVAVLSPSDGLKYKVLYGDTPFHKDVRESTFNKIKELGYDAIEQENGEVIILNKDMFKLENMKDNGLKAKDRKNTMGLKPKK